MKATAIKSLLRGYPDLSRIRFEIQTKDGKKDTVLFTGAYWVEINKWEIVREKNIPAYKINAKAVFVEILDGKSLAGISQIEKPERKHR